jgi:predicted NAD/FAD-dependent oxidoreductase
MTSRVAIVGGGVAGLSLASFLSRGSANVHVTVFDTGERACGGRLSSKSIDGVDVDHGAQYFTSTSQVFREEFVKPLVDAGVLETWSDDAVGVLRSGAGGFEAFKDGADRYVGVGGFRALAEHLEGYADEVRRPQWVGAMSASRFDDEGRVTEWRLATSDNDRAKQLGAFNFVVIAHNGKCAHRLTSTAKGDGACHKVRNSLKCVFGIRPSDRNRSRTKARFE